jgi:hypothetical protein
VIILDDVIVETGRAFVKEQPAVRFHSRRERIVAERIGD